MRIVGERNPSDAEHSSSDGPVGGRSAIGAVRPIEDDERCR